MVRCILYKEPLVSSCLGCSSQCHNDSQVYFQVAQSEITMPIDRKNSGCALVDFMSPQTARRALCYSQKTTLCTNSSALNPSIARFVCDNWSEQYLITP